MCATCGKPNAEERCNDCKTPYCSHQCQKFDWENGHENCCRTCDVPVPTQVPDLNLCPVCFVNDACCGTVHKPSHCCDQCGQFVCGECTVHCEKCPHCRYRWKREFTAENIRQKINLITNSDRQGIARFYVLYKLALMRLSVSNPDCEIEIGHVKSMEVLFLCAQSGMADAVYQLGMISKSHGPLHVPMSNALLTKSAHMGYAGACTELAKSYHRNKDRALECFTTKPES